MSHAPKLVADGEQPAQRRIFEGLRAQIMEGRLAPGTRLPSTRALAVAWKSNFFTVHTALSALAKEGWVDRRPCSGTFIADPANRFSCAGIYHDSELGSNEQRAFIRSLHFSLLKGFERLGKDTQVFIDSRPVNKQQKLLPTLAEAIRLQRIQCLVSPMLNSFNEHSLTRLTMPSAFGMNTATQCYVNYDMEAMLREAVRRLVAQGCRSIAMINNLKGYRHAFSQAIREEGLALPDQWDENAPSPEIPELEAFGYREFKRLWNLPNPPDGLFVFPDTAVHGAILAILEAGVQAVTQRMKFIFHRNAHVPVLCPFPVTWAIADEDALAQGMIDMIEKQFRREEIKSVLIRLTFKEETTLK
jgi:DNA-binding LacI/PurR family transcriptional regulator/DNA-binding transcriptional regulator YhcF (GntR family)